MSIEHALNEYLGVLGMAKAAPVFLSERGEHCILAVNREMLIDTRAALALAHDSLELLGVSGTLKGLKEHKP